MLKYTALAFLAYISQNNGEQQTINCLDKMCTLKGNQTKIITAGRSTNVLIIDCGGKNQCKKNGGNPGLIVYSSANSTYINCDDENSCEDIEVNLGILPPNGNYNTLDYITGRTRVKINCINEQSCKGIKINTKGSITNGIIIELPTDDITKPNAFKNGKINCDDTNCIVNCGNIVDMCKDARCIDNLGGNCQCNGNACPGDFNKEPTPGPTSIPTINTLAPVITPKPTPSPIDIRNSTECLSGICVFNDITSNYDINCAVTANKCVINCNNENQCQNGVIIQANSNEVELNCLQKNSCDKVQIINTQQSNIIIKVASDKGAEKMDIVIGNSLSVLYLEIMGQNGWKMGKLICDGQCTVDCMGIDSCNTAIYECLETKDKCECNTNDNSCPEITFFGDSSCSSEPCILKPTGNERIVAPNNVNNLIIDCSESEAQCKKNGAGLTVFTAAKQTTIKCLTKDACEGITVKAGALTGTNLPKGFKANQFTTPTLGINEEQTLLINCDSECGCKAIDLYTTGAIKTDITGDGFDTLQRAQLKCDSCKSLDVECRDFNGCVDSVLACTSDTLCHCTPLFVFVNLTQVTTTEPRDTCPVTVSLRKSVISASESVKYTNNNINTVNYLLPILLMFTVFTIIVVGYIIYNRNNKYNKIKDNKNEKMVKNENIYATYNNYQVEMF